ncbi:MAG: transcriptional regulator [Desulfobacterales bacterium S5133MH16]|nr:MAG: transcriptional regulator [Desulfobacterales bacterium S5133MH16]
MQRSQNKGCVKTIRKQMIELLENKEMSARELSRTIEIREKEVYAHLSHIARSVAAQRKKLIIIPAECLVCGYVFENRKRYTRPSRCPHCKSEHIQNPVYRID